MRLRPEEVHLIVDRLMSDWKTQNLVTFKVPEAQLQTRLIDIFQKELRVEDDLTKEVEAMLAKYEKDFASGALDRRKMYQMVKNQLVKERKLVL